MAEERHFDSSFEVAKVSCSKASIEVDFSYGNDTTKTAFDDISSNFQTGMVALLDLLESL